MIKEIKICYCDMCKEEIPIVKRKDIFGIEREYYRLGKVEVDNYKPDLMLCGIHLCERCACEVSMDLMKQKIEILTRTSK